jgi:hypothetical protein
MKVYTLPVIDEDGAITGKPGAVLVGERELEHREYAWDLRDLRVGQTAREVAYKAMASVVLVGGGKFQRILVRREVGQVVVQVWERVA